MIALNRHSILTNIIVFSLLMSFAVPFCFGQGRFRGRHFRDSKTDQNRSTPSTSDSSASASKLLTQATVALTKVSDTDLSTSIENLQRLTLSIDQALIQQVNVWDTSENRSPWGVMHATLAWGLDGEILVDGKPYNAIASLCENKTLKGVKMLELEDGNLTPRQGPGLQGHPGQFLAILAQNNIDIQREIICQGQKFTVSDLVEYEKATCETDSELTFKLIGLNFYLTADATWTANDGTQWSVERLLREEIAQPINKVTCGGTHRLMAISLALKRRLASGESLTGTWEIASTYIDDYQQYALTLFNPDGSFSSEWFERRGALRDPQRWMQTTGHVLEWLAVSLSDEQLLDPRIIRSVTFLSELLKIEAGQEWSIGPRAHALRSLRLYKARLQGLIQAQDTRIASNLDSNQPSKDSDEDQNPVPVSSDHRQKIDPESEPHPDAVEF